MSNYKQLKNTWVNCKENYAGPVTLSLPEWKNYVSSGNSTLLGAGGVIPGGTVQTPFGGNGTVYSGHVRQGYGGFGENFVSLSGAVRRPYSPKYYDPYYKQPIIPGVN